MEEKVIVTRRKLTAIGDNIRTQTKTTKQYTLDEMANMKLGGSDTSDATATSEDILLGKTAYVNDVKVVGAIEDYNGEQEGGEPHVRSLKKLLDYTKSSSYLFRGNTTITDLTDFINYSDTENVTNMSYMHDGCSALTTIPQLDTSKVTNMDGMFQNCSALTTIPQLDTSNVTIMYNMFKSCSALTTIPQLDTSKVTNMYGMFNGCSALTSIPQLDTSKVTTMYNMFSSCTALTSIPQLDTSKVTSMKYMFEGCMLLTTIDISHYNISTTNDTQRLFSNCYSLKAVIIRGFGTSYALNSNITPNCYHFWGTVNATYNPTGAKDGYIYVPSAMVDTLKSATNWSKYADQIRALEDYTVDGTVNGELDESKI